MTKNVRPSLTSVIPAAPRHPNRRVIRASLRHPGESLRGPAGIHRADIAFIVRAQPGKGYRDLKYEVPLGAAMTLVQGLE